MNLDNLINQTFITDDETIEDNRGQVGWVDGKIFVMEDFGPLPEGFRLTPSDEYDRMVEMKQARSRATEIINRRVQRQTAQTETFTETEFGLFAKAGLYDAWKPGETYHANFRLVHEGVVYEVMQQVLALEHQPPGGTGMLAVYRPVSANPEGGGPTGAADDPIPFINGMDVTNGLYYAWNGHTYLAKSGMPACVWPPDTQGLWQWELTA